VVAGSPAAGMSPPCSAATRACSVGACEPRVCVRRHAVRGEMGAEMPDRDIQGRTWADATAAHSSVSAWVAAEPITCFDYVANFSLHDEWTRNPVKIVALDGATPGLGTRYRAVGHQSGKDWPSELEVTIYEPPLTFEFTATGGPIGTPADDPHRHTFTFAAEDDGTRIVLVRRDPYPPDWSRFKRALAPLIVRLTLGTRKRTVADLRRRLIARPSQTLAD
jgi:Polyketide cyclase / dehydrase and lipid transport